MTTALNFSVFLDLKKIGVGKWDRLMCIKDASISFAQENETKSTFNCGTETSIDNIVNMNFTVGRVLNPIVLKNLLNVNTLVRPTGVYSLNVDTIVKSDKIYVVEVLDKDNAGIANLVIQSGGTTLISGTDYTVATVKNETTITFVTPNVGDEVNITGDINVNEANTFDKELGTNVLEKIDARFIARETVGGVERHFFIKGNDGVSLGEYIMKFLNKTDGGVVEGTEINLKFDAGTITMMDEITPAKAII